MILKENNMSNTSDYLAISACTERLKVDGVTYAYRSFGKPSKHPLVLLQRFRGTMDDWDPALLEILARDRQIVVFDNAGVGLSSGSVASSVFGIADTAAAFIRGYTNNSGAPVDILGWSLGGIVSFALALQSPNLVRRLVMAAASPGGDMKTEPAPQKVWQIAGKPKNEDDDFLYLFFPETTDGRAVGQKHLERLTLRQSDNCPPVKAESVQAQFAALMQIGERDEMLSRVGEIDKPVLMATGIEDVMINPYASFAATKGLPQGQCIVYPQSGHGFLFHHIESFANDVGNFLDR
jgi:pimeloyl-ACP methyl ester carboxylesterase